MNIRLNKRVAAMLFASTALASADAALAVPLPPEFANADANGVDRVAVEPWFTVDEGSIGSGDGALRMLRFWVPGSGFTDNWRIGLFDVGTTKTYVQIGGTSEIFTRSGTTFTNDKANGATLVVLTGGNYLYTTRDGTKIEFAGTPFNEQGFPCPGSVANSCRVPLYVLRPNGLKFTFTWDTALAVFKRLASVTSSAGYTFAIQYKTNSSGAGSQPTNDWFERTKVDFNNLASPLAVPMTITYSSTNAGARLYVSDIASRIWAFDLDGGNLESVTPPGESGRGYAYSSGGLVFSHDGEDTTYAQTTVGSTRTTTTTDALGNHSVVVTDLHHDLGGFRFVYSSSRVCQPLR